MNKIYLIRHGETTWNKEKKFQGCTNTPLTDLGVAQGEKLARRLENVKFTALYTSPLKRAAKTADLISLKQEVTATEDERFKEIFFGDFEGKTFRALGEEYPWFQEWTKDPSMHKIPNGDNLQEVLIKTEQVFKDMCEKIEGGEIGIVTHAGFIRLVVLALMGLPLAYYWRFSLNNTSITVFTYKNGKFNLETLNDFAHCQP